MNIIKKDLTINGAAAYQAYPDDGKKYPGLVLIEEIWGVNGHIRSVVDRFAAEGYNVISPELLPEGLLAILTPQLQQDLFDPEKRNEVQPKLRAAMAPTQQPEYAEHTIATLKACVDHLMADERVNGAIGVVGFCFGGTYSFHLAAHDPRVKAAAPFYGHPPAEGEIADITCPILAFYGDQDANLMESLPALKEDMKKNGKVFDPIVYPGAGHAFFNDTNPRMYNREAADDAWKKVLAFFKANMAS
ncbi:MAG TPA: dienelactone hydrolase family protein [Candidatus Paceibacterota bacterium]|nr:dienelactone hydrolase family protein [Candidatus Paceibacterota bacterium]